MSVYLNKPSPVGRGDRLRWERFYYLFRQPLRAATFPRGDGFGAVNDHFVQ